MINLQKSHGTYQVRIKQFENESGYRYNKKRYWASKQDLPEIRRYILKTMTLDGSFSELIDWVPFDFRDIFVFPDKSGWWFEYVPTGREVIRHFKRIRAVERRGDRASETAMI